MIIPPNSFPGIVRDCVRARIPHMEDDTTPAVVEADGKARPADRKRLRVIILAAASLAVIAALACAAAFRDDLERMILRAGTDELARERLKHEALVAVASDDLDAAVGNLERASRAWPEDRNAVFDLVSAYVLRGDDGRALDVVVRMLERAPDDEEALAWRWLLERDREAEP